MSVFKRIRDMTVAGINDVLDRVEDPGAMLNQYMRDIESEISHAETALARQNAMEKKWGGLIDGMTERLHKRERQAQLAVDTGEDDVARRALQDKAYCQAKLDEYRAQYETAQAQKHLLGEQLRELKDKYDEMRNKKYALAARANVAQASKQMHAAMTSVDTESAAQGFSRIEERVMMMEADATAYRKMRQIDTSENPDGREIVWGDTVEQELRIMKEKRQAPTSHKDVSEASSNL